jgi:hypothetical protein
MTHPLSSRRFMSAPNSAPLASNKKPMKLAALSGASATFFNSKENPMNSRAANPEPTACPDHGTNRSRTRLRNTLLCALFIMPSSLGIAHAQQVNPTQQANPSFKELIEAGFEIKNVVLLSGDQMHLLDQSRTLPEFAVSLQRAAATAVCEFNFSSWNNQLKASLEGRTQCSVYPSDAVVPRP